MLSSVDLVDARSGGLLYAVHPLDKSANADGQRRRLDHLRPDLTPLPATTMAPLCRHGWRAFAGASNTPRCVKAALH